MNLNEQLKSAGVNDKFDQEVDAIITSMIATLKKRGYAHKSFCDDSNWEYKTRHMNRVASYFRGEGLAVRTELRYEVWDLYVEVQ